MPRPGRGTGASTPIRTRGILAIAMATIRAAIIIMATREITNRMVMGIRTVIVVRKTMGAGADRIITVAADMIMSGTATTVTTMTAGFLKDTAEYIADDRLSLAGETDINPGNYTHHNPANAGFFLPSPSFAEASGGKE